MQELLIFFAQIDRIRMSSYDKKIPNPTSKSYFATI